MTGWLDSHWSGLC